MKTFNNVAFEEQEFFGSKKTLAVMYNDYTYHAARDTKVYDLFLRKDYKAASELVRRQQQRENELMTNYPGLSDRATCWCLPKDGNGLPHVSEWILASDSWQWLKT